MIHWDSQSSWSLDEENMDMSPQTYFHLAYGEARDTPYLTKSSLSVTPLGVKDQRGLSYLFTL